MKSIPIIILSLLVLILTSCGSGVMSEKIRVKPIDKNFKGVFSNVSTKTIHRKYKKSGSILLLMGFYGVKSDSVAIGFLDKNELVVSVHNGMKRTIMKYSGKFTKSGYFKIYFNKTNVQIPPLLPLLYSRTNIDRLLFAVTENNELIIDDYSNHSGSLLLFGAGSSSRNKYIFERYK